jgi:hypothetical protein
MPSASGGAYHSESGPISPLMIFITCEALSNSDVPSRKVTQIRLSIGRPNSTANFPGVSSILRRKKCPRYLSSCVST